jgi:uncharacterized protein Yka (UPF0111/DUF47 family)
MWPAKPKPDPELLGLFEESARNVQRCSLLLRDLLADYPEQASLARDILLCEQEGDRIAHDLLHRLAGNGNGRRAALDAADVHVACSEHVAAALRGLRGGADLAPHLVEIHRLENEGDRLVRAAVASLFADGIDPMMLIRWKDIFDTLEESVDACETVANVLEGMSIKRAHR